MARWRTRLEFAGTLLLACALASCAGQPLQPGPKPVPKPGPGAGSGYPVAAGQHFRDLPQAPDLVVVPAGEFMMGSTPEETTREGRRADTAAFEQPRRRVVLPGPLAIGRFLVTRAEYRAFVDATHRAAPPGCNVLDGRWQFQAGRSFEDTAFAQTDRHPASCVNTEDAQAYAAWVSARTGHRYRLPHEAEWEYAARAGTTAARWWGDEHQSICAHANGADRSFDRVYPGDAKTNRSCDDGFVQSSPVDAFPPNSFGLHDMIGNVWEWTEDCFTEQLGAPAQGAECARRSIRGGSWHNFPDALRSAARFWLPRDMRSSSVGFRIVRLPD
jgi:formylglycine-generating enzyme required for sulfatase activity